MRACVLAVVLAGGVVAACGASGRDGEEAASEVGVARSARAELQAGRLAIETTIGADCASCEDADADGLADAWEAAVVERLRPRLVLHPDEPLLSDPDGAFGLVARVFRPAPTIVRVVFVVGFSFDPGIPILGVAVSAHDGDSERVALELELDRDGRRATVRRAYLSVHENTPNDQSSLYDDGAIAGALRFGRDPDGQPRWLVFPSRGKHAEFASPASCAASSFLHTPFGRERCAPDEASGRTLLPPVVDAGERAHPRVKDLAVVGFPGESPWADRPFCGGLRASGHSHHATCAGAIRGKLEDDPFGS